MFELATPIGVFGRDRAESNNRPFWFSPFGLECKPVTVEDGIALSGLSKLDRAIETADMVIVPTWPIVTSPIPGDLIDLLTDAHERGSRLVGLCLGAFAIAATGLLDSRTATTHWRHRERFESRHPEVTFEPNSLYVDADTVVTSAGRAAALDCCIHLLRRDHGAHIAAQVAKSMVTAPHRSGSQSQFASTPSITVGEDPITRALADAAERITEIHNVQDLAAIAGRSRRSLERHMRGLLGISPAQWIDEQRVVFACRLLETTDLPVEQVAARAGYGSTPSLRRTLHARRDTTPTTYRRSFAPQFLTSSTARPSQQ